MYWECTAVVLQLCPLLVRFWDTLEHVTALLWSMHTFLCCVNQDAGVREQDAHEQI